MIYSKVTTSFNLIHSHSTFLNFANITASGRC